MLFFPARRAIIAADRCALRFMPRAHRTLTLVLLPVVAACHDPDLATAP